MTYETNSVNTSLQPDVIKLCLNKDLSVFSTPPKGFRTATIATTAATSSGNSESWRTIKLEETGHYNFDNYLWYDDKILYEDDGEVRILFDLPNFSRNVDVIYLTVNCL